MEQKDQVKTKRSPTAQKAGTGPCAQQETLWYTNFAEKWEQALPGGKRPHGWYGLWSYLGRYVAAQ